jgi:hypothetical protein
MGTVGIDSSSINSSDVYSGGRGGGMGFWARVANSSGNFFDKTLRRPRAGFAKCANGAPRDVVADGFQCFRIFDHAAAAQHAVGDFLHPKRAFPAGCALAAALVRVKLVDVVQAQTMSRESSSTITPPEPAIEPAAARESKSIGISSIDISRSLSSRRPVFPSA